MTADLETVLRRLQAAEINAWIATAPPAHIQARMHGPDGGADIVCDFRP